MQQISRPLSGDGVSPYAVVSRENRRRNPQPLEQFCEQPDGSPVKSDIHQPLPPINIAPEKRRPTQASELKIRIIACEFRIFCNVCLRV